MPIRKTISLALATCALGLLPSACGSPSDEEAHASAAPEPVAQAPAQPAPAPEPAPAPPPHFAPDVQLLVGGKPATATDPAAMAKLGEGALDYLLSCLAQEDKQAGELSWSMVRESPLCVLVRLAPPAEVTVAGRRLGVEELLLPLGAPRYEGRAFARAGDASPPPFLEGDPALYAHLKDTAMEALGTSAMPAELAAPAGPEAMTEPVPPGDEPALPAEDLAPPAGESDDGSPTDQPSSGNADDELPPQDDEPKQR